MSAPDMPLLLLTAEERRQLSRAAFIQADRQRYGATRDPDPQKRAEIRARWLTIADAFDPEPYGPEIRVAELASRAREAAEATP